MTPPDGPPERNWPDGEPALDFVVPDDISELAAEVEALRRERTARARRARLQRWMPPGRWQRRGVPGAVVLATLLVVGVFGGMLALLAPRSQPPAAPGVPLAAPSVPAGRIGGLLPAIELTSRGRPLPARRLPRPALLVLVPPGCSCDTAASLISEQAAEIPVEVVFVARGPDERVVDGYAAAAPDLAIPATDPTGALSATYGPSDRGVTLVFVRTDGVVTSVRHGFAPGDRLETSLDVVQANPTAVPTPA